MNAPRAGNGRPHPLGRLENGGPAPPQAAPLLTVAEVCRLLGMSRRWVHERTRRREIPCYRFGTALRFDREEIRQWMANFHAAHTSS